MYALRHGLLLVLLATTSSGCLLLAGKPDPVDPLTVDDDGDGLSEQDGDCDDVDASNFPGNAEVCDGADNDCNGLPDFPGEAVDGDDDGVPECADCADDDANRGGEGADEDCDGIPTAEDCDDQDAQSSSRADDADCDGVPTAQDCDDDDVALGDRALDADCDGAVGPADCAPMDPKPCKVVDIAAGANHACAVFEGGQLRCWGSAAGGRLGYGDLVSHGYDGPVTAAGNVPVGAAVESVSAGSDSTCVVLAGGAVRCWGANDRGQLGVGDRAARGDDETAAAVPNVSLPGTFRSVKVGHAAACALNTDNEVWCWGRGDNGLHGQGLGAGDLGDDETLASLAPLQLPDARNVGGFGGVLDIDAGETVACAVVADQGVYCWGQSDFGMLGVGDVVEDTDDTDGDGGGMSLEVTRTDLPEDAYRVLSSTVRQLTVGRYHACLVDTRGRVLCWGGGRYGRLGYGDVDDVGDDEMPFGKGYVSLGGDAAEVTAGEFHTCARLEDGTVRCWGGGLAGALGLGNTADVGDDEVPSSVGTVPLGQPATKIAAGKNFTCALLEDGTVRCWGANDLGQLGRPGGENLGDDEAPNSVGPVEIALPLP